MLREPLLRREHDLTGEFLLKPRHFLVQGVGRRKELKAAVVQGAAFGRQLKSVFAVRQKFHVKALL